jgi:hypothetical protein
MSEVMMTGRLWAARTRLQELIAKAARENITLFFDLSTALEALNAYERARDLVENKPCDAFISREEMWTALGAEPLREP